MAVSWLLLAFGIWVAMWTFVSFRPPQRPAPLMAVAFFAAWLTTELAPLHVVWQLLVVVGFVWLGALDHVAGWIGLALTIVSWGFLAASVRGATQTVTEFSNALLDGLGPDWNANLDPELAAASRRIEWSRIILPFKFKRRGVRRTKNIQYVPGDTMRRHRLDVYRHKDTGPNAPVLLQIHGGGWMIGNKDQQGLPLMYHLAARGWVCVAINYRLSPKATWPDHLVDCKRALAWVREHVAEHGGDPDYVVVTGGSAGGHLTALMGLTANDPQFQPGFEAVDTRVQAMIPFYGVFDWSGQVAATTGSEEARKRDNGLRDVLERFVVKRPFDEAPEVYAAASPITHVRPDAPPALVIHGDLDTLAPIAEARLFVEKLRATSHQPVVYVELRGAHHAFEVFNSIRALHTIAGVDLFLAWLLSARDAGRSRPAVAPTGTAGAAPAAIDPIPTARTEP